MSNTYELVMVTYNVGAMYLAQRGNYISAEATIKNPFRGGSWKSFNNKHTSSKGEEVIINEPMKIVSHPVWTEANTHVTLGDKFIEGCNYRPKKQFSQRQWDKLSKKQQIEWHIKKYVSDLNGNLVSFEIV